MTLLPFLLAVGLLSCLPLQGEENKPQLAKVLFSLPENFDELGLDEGLPAQALLEKHGVIFPSGSSARFLEASNQLEVTNHEEELMISEAVLTLWNRTGYVSLEEKQAKRRERVERKLKEIIITPIEFKGKSLAEALEWLEEASAEFDITTENDSEKGIAISLERPVAIEIKSAREADAFGFESSGKSNDNLSSEIPIGSHPIAAPLGEVLRYILALEGANLKYSVTENGVTVHPHHQSETPLETVVYSIPPGFNEMLKSLLDAQESSECFPEDPFQGKKGKKVSQNLTTRELLEWMGISFPIGSFIQILETKNLFVVKNSRDQIELVEALLEVADAKASPEWQSQQEALIQSKLASIRLPDLSYDKASIYQIIEKLTGEILRLDTESEIWNRGIIIDLKKSNSNDWSDQWNREISIKLEKTTASEAIEKLGAKLDGEVIITPRGVTFLTA